ncbi:MAG: hypothetical protein ACRDPA_24265, partial [Solirubrobacteraceae bacterium]
MQAKHPLAGEQHQLRRTDALQAEERGRVAWEVPEVPLSKADHRLEEGLLRAGREQDGSEV